MCLILRTLFFNNGASYQLSFFFFLFLLFFSFFICDQSIMFGLLLRVLSFGIFFQIVSSTTYTCLSNATCGCSVNSATLTRIVGGEVAASQTWGWAVSIRNRYTGNHFCGGSIISRSHILTAAHCTIDSFASTLRVYVGSTSLSSTVQVRSVSTITNHPSYSSSNYLNDIAILKLSSPLDLDTAGVDLICLPDGNAIGEYPPANVDVKKQLKYILMVSF